MSIYKGEDMIAGPTQQKFVRKPAWSRAESVTAAQIAAGYAAPKDGYLCCQGPNESGGRSYTINGIAMPLSITTNTSVCIPLSQGDVITLAAYTAWGSYKFVPFEDSIIGDPITITPEYIRNLHDPDWSQAVAITTATYTMPGRGLLVGVWFEASSSNTSNELSINGIRVAQNKANDSQKLGCVQVPVNQGDSMAITGGTSITVVMHFVPYKQQ